MNILADFHHSTLLHSLYLTFEERLGHTVYRPIGLEWFEEGYWKINDQRDTAEQFLSLGQVPADGTPALNNLMEIIMAGADYEREDGVFYCGEPGDWNRAITLEAFKHMRFDILIASMPQHVEPFRLLIQRFQPHAKLIVQLGNEWNIQEYSGMNVLASIAPRPTDANALFYHQEFSTKIFTPKPFGRGKRIYSFINILQNMPVGWTDFLRLERDLNPFMVEFRSFGGQCRDGNIEGIQGLADKIAEASMIFHVKDGGDGFGHIIHNAYACGRPVITRRSFYRHKLADELLVPGTFIDLDAGFDKESMRIGSTVLRRDVLEEMGEKAAARFREVVDFDHEGELIKEWLTRLR